jgi:hypothetical protein
VGGPSAGYNLTWDGTANYNNSGTRSESGTLGQSYTFSASSLSVNSGYEETSALSLSGGGVVNGTFGTGATSYQTTASGTVAVESPNSISLGPTGTCANAACINSSPSTNWYYFGSLSAATLWSNLDGVSGSNPSNGYYNNGSGALLYTGGVISISNSCQSFVSYTGLGNGGTSTSACTDSQNDFFYITGGQLQTAQGVWNDSTACNGAGSNYYSDGTNWAYTGGSGIITSSGPC